MATNGLIKNKNWFIFPTLKGYKISWLTFDIIAGVTLAAVAIPEQMATAQLAGMPVVTGLYTFILAVFMTAVISGSRYISIGSDSTIAPIVAAGIMAMAAKGSPDYISLVALTAIVTGILALAVGLLKLGWIADFISKPVMTGFIFGLIVAIIIGELSPALGIPSGGSHLIGQISHLVSNLNEINVYAAFISIGVLAIIFGSQAINKRIPGPLIALVLSILAVSVFGLNTLHHVKVLGELPSGLPVLTIPSISWKLIVDVLPISVAVLLICLTQTSVTSRTFVNKIGLPSNINRDFTALGASNVATGMFGGFPADASPARTAVVESMGAKSQLACIFAAFVVICILVFAPGSLALLPNATLAAVLIAVAYKIMNTQAMVQIYKFSTLEFSLAVFTALAVAFIGVQQGMLLAVLIAIIDRTYLSARPEAFVMGRSKDGVWSPATKSSKQIPGVLAFLLNGPLWFANANWFSGELKQAYQNSEIKPKIVVIDAAGLDNIDYTAAQVLEKLALEAKSLGINFSIAGAFGDALESINKIGLIDLCSQKTNFENVEEAVKALTPDLLNKK